MNEKLIPTVLSVAFVGFVLYALIFMSPLEKIDAACTPVTLWPGKLLSSAVRVADPVSAHKIDLSIQRGFGSCRRWVWNVFYDDKYQKLRQEGGQ